MAARPSDGRETADRPSPPTHLRRDDRRASLARQGAQNLVHSRPHCRLRPGKCARPGLRCRPSDRHRSAGSAGPTAYHCWRPRRCGASSHGPVQTVGSLGWTHFDDGETSCSTPRTPATSSNSRRLQPPSPPSGDPCPTRPSCCQPSGSSPTSDSVNDGTEPRPSPAGRIDSKGAVRAGRGVTMAAGQQKDEGTSMIGDRWGVTAGG